MKDEFKTREQLIAELAALRQQTQREQLMAEIAQRVRQNLDLDKVLNTAVKEVQEFLQAQRVFIYRFEQDGSGVITVEAANPSCTSILGQKIADSFFIDPDRRKLYQQNRTQVITDIYTSNLSACHVELLAKLQIRANLVVPILQGEQLWGLLVANQCSESRQWQKWEIDLLKQLATQVSIAIQQSTLFEQLQTELNQRQQVEAILQEKQRFIERVLETTPDILYVYDLMERRNVYINRQIVEILGYTCQDIQSRGETVLPSLIHPDDMAQVNDHLQRFQNLQDGEILNIEYRMKHANGEWRWLHSRETVFARNADGLTVQILGIASDITQRKRSEEEIYFQAHLLSAVEQAVIATNLDGRIIYWNRFAETLYDWSAQEVKDKNILEVILPQTSQQQALEIMSQLQRGESWAGELIVQRKDGTTFLVSVTNSPIYDQQGRLIGIIGISNDITERKNAIKKLQESEERFRTMADAAPVMIWMADTNKLFNYFNKTWLEFTGHTLEQEISNCWVEAVHPNDKQDFSNTYTDAFDIRQQFTREYRLRRFDGEYCWILDIGTPRFDSDGSFMGYIGSAIDITERKEALEALQESEARLKLALEAASMCIWDWNISNNKMVYFNEDSLVSSEFLNSYLNTYEAFLNAVHSEDRKRIDAGIKNAIEQGTIYETEFRIIGPNAELFWLESKGQVFYDQLGKAIRMVGVSMEITKRKQAEAKICEQATLIDIATDAIVVQDLENKIISWNKSAERIYGWQAQEVISKNINELLYEISPQIEKALYQAKDVGEWYGEMYQKTNQGKEIIVESRWTLVRDEQGNPKSILTVNTDITQKKQLEVQFHRAQRLDSLGTLATGITHDLNNILAPILMSAQLLQMRVDGEQNQILLQNIEKNAQRAAALVKQVLLFACGVEGKHSLLQPNIWIQEIQQLVQDIFPKNIKLCVDIAPDIWMISGNVTQLNQVLINLVINARDAMPNGGILSISVKNSYIDETYTQMNLNTSVGTYVVITIKDTGIGMPSEILDRIFEPFFTTKEMGKGSGLGLSIVLGIIKSHGGFINVSSTVNQGTKFQVFLKAAVENQVQLKEELELPAGNGELILVVDDEAKIRETSKAMLSTYNYQVLTANDGIEAIALYAQKRKEISVVLVDMGMPEMDGLDTIRTLQKFNPFVKIIATSGLLDSQQLIQTSDIETFLLKPYTIRQLLQILQNILN